jgi:hypothetical protein
MISQCSTNALVFKMGMNRILCEVRNDIYIYTHNLHERQSSKGHTFRAFGEIKLQIPFVV